MLTHKSNFIDKIACPPYSQTKKWVEESYYFPGEKQLDVEDPATLPKGLPLGHITEGEGEFAYNP